MAFDTFKKRKNDNKDFVKSIVSKSKQVTKSKTTVKTGGNSLHEKISSLCDMVQQKLGHLADKYICIQDINQLHDYITAAIDNGYISLDTETTGLDPITDQIVGACIYTPGQIPAYIPINHVSLITRLRLNNQLTNEQVRIEFQRLVDNNVKVIYFNAKFDMRVCKHQLGVDLPIYWDAMIAARCLKENEEENNLKYLWTKYCSENKDAPHFTFDKLFKGYTFNLIPIKTAYLYAANDAIITWELFKFQEPYLTEDNPRCIECDLTRLAKLFREIEMPIVKIIAEIEDNGVAIDIPYCDELSQKYNKLLVEAEHNFNEALKPYQDKLIQYMSTHPNTKIQTPFNIASPSQLAELFYDVLGLQSVDKKSPRGTGEEILKQLGHPLVEPILKYREIAKLVTTYIDKMPKIVNSKTGRIHCTYKQIGADTGRFASSDPNLQNIPSHNSDIRPMFVASTFDIIDADTEMTLLRQDQIKIQGGKKKVPELIVGDIIVDEQLKPYTITNIIDNNDTFKITFERRLDG